MRHYAHNIGDYAAATRHLSFVEDAAYRRLLDRYYQDEKPLPADIAAVARLAGARSKDEREAVANVLAEFFTLEADGYHQNRADREIETYQAKAQAARENGTKGGRPVNREKTKSVSDRARQTDRQRKNSDLAENKKLSDESASTSTKSNEINESENRTETNPVSRRGQTQKATTPHSPLTTPHHEAAASSEASARGAETDDLKPPAHLDRSVDQALAAYQSIAKVETWPEVMFLNGERRVRLQAILHICGGLDGWKAALETARDAKFLHDSEGRIHGWFDFDWLLDQRKFTRLMEGRYAERHRDDKSTTSSDKFKALADLGREGFG